ncbi:MAG: hypothetical protein WA962_11705, partial [Ornithinimicrobium sp.]
TEDWSIDNSYIRGHIDTRQAQNVRMGTLSNTVLECEAAIDDWIVQCSKVSNVTIRSRGRGVFCDDAVNLDVRAEAGASLAVTGSAANCRLGGMRREGETRRVEMAEGQAALALSEGVRLVSLRRMNPAVQGGKWFEIHHSDYKVVNRTVQFSLAAQAGDVIEIQTHEVNFDKFAVRAEETAFELTRPGGLRPGDILSVTSNGILVPEGPEGYSVSPTGDGRATLALAAAREGDVLEVAYLPPLLPYAGLVLAPSARGLAVRADVTCRNVGGVRFRADALLSGTFEDVTGEAAFNIDDGVSASLRDVMLTRCSGGVVAGSSTNAVPHALRIVGCLFQDWGMARGATESQGLERRGVGGHARSGLHVTSQLVIQGTTWICMDTYRSSDDIGRLSGAGTALAVMSGNAFVGVRPLRPQAQTLVEM